MMEKLQTAPPNTRYEQTRKLQDLQASLNSFLDKLNKNKTLSRDKQSPIQEFITYAVVTVNILNNQINLLEGELIEKIEKILTTQQKDLRSVKATYAEAVCRAAESKQPASHTIIVTDPQREKTAKEIRRDLEQNVQPRKIGVKITKVVESNNKNLLIKVATKEQAETLAKELEKGQCFQAKELINSSQVILFNVHTAITEAEILSALQEYGTFTTVRTFTGRGDSNNWILESSTLSVSKLLRTPRVYLGFRSWIAKKYHKVIQCFNCQRLGHTAHKCSHPTACAKCGAQHQTRNCQVVTEELFCINCDRASKQHGTELHTQHAAYMKSCPVQKEALSNLIAGRPHQPQQQEQTTLAECIQQQDHQEQIHAEAASTEKGTANSYVGVTPTSPNLLATTEASTKRTKRTNLRDRRMPGLNTSQTQTKK